MDDARRERKLIIETDIDREASVQPYAVGLCGRLGGGEWDSTPQRTFYRSLRCRVGRAAVVLDGRYKVKTGDGEDLYAAAIDA